MNKPLALLLAALTAASSTFAAGIRTATLDVANMDCAVCPITVRKALERVPGVDSAKVDFTSKQAVVTFDPSRTTPAILTKATSDAGFPSSAKHLR